MAAPSCGKCIKALPGQRVVRGPDWWGGDEDGGVGHVGTVVSVFDPHSPTRTGYASHPIEVQWDAGPLGCYRACCTSRTCDLQLIDAGPSGVIFPNITCSYCETEGVTGTLWTCAECADYNLCHPCYMNDKHNLEHEFFRCDKTSSEKFRVPSRKKSTKIPFYGIFPGAKVRIDTEVKNGIVANVRGKARLLRTTASDKLWYHKSAKVDDTLMYIEKACGGDYYPDHMPAIACPGHDPKDMDLFRMNWKTLSPGDCVRVIYAREQVRRLQSTNPHNYTNVLSDWCGIEGRVESFTKHGWFFIRDGRQNGGTFNPKCVFPLKTPSRSAINMLRRDISSGGKGLGYSQPDTAALNAACHSGKEDLVTILLAAGADLEEPDENGDTAVHHAAGCENSKILELLLSAGANISACNTFNETALHIAISERSVDCAKLLAMNIKDSDINIQDNFGDTVLHSAIKAGMKDITNVLLKHPRVDVGIKNNRGATPLHVAVGNANMGATQQILEIRTDVVDEKNKKNMTALYIAAANNLYNIAKTLVVQGHCNLDIDCGYDFKTALATAVSRGCSDVVELLVESGADVNKPDCRGNAPLHICVTNTRPLIPPSRSGAPKLSLMAKNLQEASSQRQLTGLALAGILASKGGDLQQENEMGLTPPELCDSTALIEMLLLWNIQESATGRYREQLSGLVKAKDKNGIIPLHREALNGRHHVAQMLLAQGLVAVDAVSGQGSRTALSLAAERGHMQLVKVLVEAGADVNKLDAKGNTPLHSSLMSPRCEIIEYLVASGADVNKQDANGNTPLHISLINRRAVNASEINPAVAPKLKAITTELKNVNHSDIDTTLVVACFFISQGSSLKIKNAQGLNPLNILGAPPVIRTLLKWAPKTSEPPAEDPAVDGSAEDNTASADGGAASSMESIDGPQSCHTKQYGKKPCAIAL